MTKKEAIKVLRTESIELGGSAASVCRFWEALDMAIAALREQEGKDTYVSTNADRIRAMSDEELAKAIFNWFYVKEHCDMCVPEMRTPKKCNGRCTSGILRWLQQPAEDDKA